MKLLILSALILTVQIASADTSFLNSSHQPLTKAQAVKQLLDTPTATIYRCNEVQLTENLTMKNRKSAKRD